MISYNLYYSVAATIYNMSHGLMVPLSTRNTAQRGSLSVFNNISAVMVSGIIVALVFLEWDVVFGCYLFTDFFKLVADVLAFVG